MAEFDHDGGDAQGGSPGGLNSDGGGGIQGGQSGDGEAPSGQETGTDAGGGVSQDARQQDNEEGVERSPLQEHMGFKTSLGLDDDRPKSLTGVPDYRAMRMPGGGYYSPSDSDEGSRTSLPGAGSNKALGAWNQPDYLNTPAAFSPSFDRYGGLPTNALGKPDFRAISTPGGYYSPESAAVTPGELSLADKISWAMQRNVRGGLNEVEHTALIHKEFNKNFSPAEFFKGYVNEGKPSDAEMWNASLPRIIGRILGGAGSPPDPEGAWNVLKVGYNSVFGGKTLTEAEKWQLAYNAGKTAVYAGTVVAGRGMKK